MDMTVSIGNRSLPNPVGVASGTFGYGSEYEQLINLDGIGALYAKAVTVSPRVGNEVPRIIETPSGLLNSIGLANVGMYRFVTEKLPYLRGFSCPVVANIAGDVIGEYREIVEFLEENDPENDLWGFEVNVSCPNVKAGGMALGTDPKLVESLTETLRRATSRPLIVKLTPNVTDVAEIASAAEAGGADAVSCVNTFVGMAIDIERQHTVLPGGTGGLSGPAIRPLGVAIVYRVSRSVTIPVIGIGGISEPEDALEYLLAGASAVQVGTANFVDPTTVDRVRRGIADYMERRSYESISDLHGLLG
jgi:dihydroorotate dehydrogenase (NAD+) catalytic subunit